MNDQLRRARRIGGKKAARAFLFVLLIFEGFALFLETRGDFANGILFFIKLQTDIGSLSLLLLLFLAVFLFGRAAGKQILVDRKDPVLVGLLYAVLTFFIICGYVAGFIYFKRIRVVSWTPFLAIISLFISLTWLVAARQIKRAGEPGV